MQEPKIMGCRNEEDPFTLEDLEGLEERRIINIDQNCFDLKPLFNWVYNQEKFTNPLTNLPFSQENLNRIKQAALKDFPCEVKTRVGIIKTTTLSTFQRVFINVMKKLVSSYRVETLFDAMIESVNNMKIAFRVRIDEGFRGIFSANLPAFLIAELKNENLRSGEEPSLSEFMEFEDRPLADVPGYLDSMRIVMSLIGYDGGNLRSVESSPQIIQPMYSPPVRSSYQPSNRREMDRIDFRRPLPLSFEIRVTANLMTYQRKEFFQSIVNDPYFNNLKLEYLFTVNDNPKVNTNSTVGDLLNEIADSFRIFPNNFLGGVQREITINIEGENIQREDPIRVLTSNPDSSGVNYLSVTIDYKEPDLEQIPSQVASPISPRRNNNNNNLYSPRSPGSPDARNFQFFNGPDSPRSPGLPLFPQ